MRFALLVALSHLRSRQSESGVSVITLIAIAGVTVGVTAMIMVLAVMEGFELDLRDKILGSNAHLVVLNYTGNFSDYTSAVEAIEGVEGITAAAPFVYSEAMIRSSHGSTGVVLKGIDPLRSGGVTDVVDNIKLGADGPLTTVEEREAVLATLSDPPRGMFQDADDLDTLPGILLGNELSDQLWVGVGDRVHIINPVGGGVGPLGMPTPDVKPFRVAGVFESGMYEYDTKWTYITIPDAQTFLKLGEVVNGIEARVDDIDGVDPIALEVEEALEYPFNVRHWKNLNRNLFAALKLEKIVMGIILSLITVVAGMNIVGTLILMVLTRTREISIFRAMGCSAGQIRTIFMAEGLLVGLVGTLLGTVLGLLGCAGLRRYEFPLDTDVYYLDTLPVVVEPLTVLVVMGTAVAISFFCTLYPTTVAARVNPVEGLRYE
ncbi:MAG: ABC transporter permease [Myxococcota bacterium]|nr:ABC transporter permease [Myxococcota bacterium]